MLLSIGYIAIALGLLFFGASWLVKGSSSLALKAGVTPLVAGLTVVALGTSSPELVVNLNASLAGKGNMAIGSVMGSNLFNILIILGISSIINPLRIKMSLIKIDIPLLIIATALFMFFFSDRLLTRFEGGILLAIIIGYFIMTVILAKREKTPEVLTEFEKAKVKTHQKWYISLVMIIAGMALLIAGSEFMIKGAVAIARALGVSETIIGLTILAVGTSLPELSSSIVATMKKEYDIAIGNVVGSNLFNTLGILGISSLVKPMQAIAISRIDLYALLGATLLLLPFARTSYTLKREEGIFMVLLYLVYMYYLWPK